jgi:hypothetical protein
MHSIFCDFCIAICMMCNFCSFFAAVLKRLRLDSTLLTQGPTLHHLSHGSTYFQCNISNYAHVQGLKLH